MFKALYITFRLRYKGIKTLTNNKNNTNEKLQDERLNKHLQDHADNHSPENMTKTKKKSMPACLFRTQG